MKSCLTTQTNYFPSHPGLGLNGGGRRGREENYGPPVDGLPCRASCLVRWLRASALSSLCQAQAYLTLEDVDKVELLPTLSTQ